MKYWCNKNTPVIAMMLLKRLLLPGKGGMIICILILLNVLLWCGEMWKEAVTLSTSNKISTFSSYSTIIVIITSLMYSSALSSSSSLCKYHGAALVTYYNIINLQFHRVYASEEVLVSLSKDPTSQPVFNKTDPLSMTLALNKGGGATLITSQHNDYNYNKRRRRSIPVHNNGSSNSSSVISSNSSNFLNHNNDSVLVNVSWSVGDGSDQLFIGGGSASSSGSTQQDDNLHNVKISPNNATMTHNLKLSKMRNSANTTLSSVAHFKRRRKGRTRTPLQNTISKNINNNQSDSTSRKRKRKPKLLKELTMFNRQNCLAKLLCGVQVAQPPTKSSSAVNDYAYLVKAFFDRFSIRGIVTDVIDSAFAYEQDGLDVLDDGEADDEEEDDVSSEKRKKSSFVKIGNKVIGGAARHKAKRPHNYYHKYNPKYYEEYDKDLEDLEIDDWDDDVPDFMLPDLLRKRMGKKFVQPFNVSECGNCTMVGVKRRNSGIVPVDINRIRRKRGIVGEVKRGFMGFFNPRFDKTSYLDKRQLEIESTDDKARQLNIAEEIASRLRSPRQCRLLNWFGNNNGIGESTSSTSPNGMTTTITTITNTGGMIGNLDRLNGLQTGLPQSVNTGSGSQGSQTVTVIQQSPVGGSNSAVLTTRASQSSKATVMLNNMGQSANNAMTQAKDVANHIGSTICPFNIHELQELILKAQGAPFPHFLTTPPTLPILPAQLGSQTKSLLNTTLTSSTTSSSTTAETTTTLQATNPPPISSTTAAGIKKSGQSRNGLDSSFSHGYDQFSDPHPTPPRYYPRPTPHYLYDDEVTPPSRPHFHHHPTTPRHRLSHHRHNPTPRPPHKYYNQHSTPDYPSPVYPTPTYHSEYFDETEKRTREPVVIPEVGIVEVEDDNDFSDEESYTSYQGSKGASPYDRHKVHHTRIKNKPVPKWMTTTTHSPEDLSYYGHNDPIPNYSYGTHKQTGYKVGSQQSYKGQEDREKQGGHKVRRPVQNRDQKKPHYAHERPEDVTFKIGPDLPRETTVIPTTDYVREFHQPPVVVDSKNKYPPVGYRQRPALPSPQFQQPSVPVRGKPPNQIRGQSRPDPQQNNKSEEDDDEDSESSDSSGESEESSSGETRGNLDPSKNPNTLPSRPDPPSLPPPPSPREAPGSVEDEEEEESNEALEKKEVGAEGEDNDDEGESDEENGSDYENNDGKRSYERNDFSKDRGGPPAESTTTTTEKPNRNNKVYSSGYETSSNGFFSGILNSFGSLTSMFNRNSKGKSQNSGSSIPMTTTHIKPLARNHPPVRNVPYPTKVPKSYKVTSGQEDSDEEEDDDDDNESEEEDVKYEKKKAKPKTTTTTPKPKKIIKLNKKSRDPPMPWVNPNSHLQVFLRTTPVPVVIEDSSSWSVNQGHKDEGDDDDDDDAEYNYNPQQSFNAEVKKKNDNKQVNEKENLYTGLGLSSDLSEFLNDLHQDLSPNNKKQKSKVANKKFVKKPTTSQSQEDYNEAGDVSDESDEDDVSSSPNRRGVQPLPFMPPEPID